MRTVFTSFVALVVLALAVGSSSAGSDVEINFEKYQLDNGLTVILHEDHDLPQVVVNTWYHCGTREEPPGHSGFAHLFEHLMFMGTKRVPGSQFDTLMESGGGANNASTWFDRTNYYDWGPTKILPTLLWLEADRMQGLGSAMTQKKLDLQRAVVRNERRESYDNAPYGPANYLFWELMFPTEHPYHFNVIGSHKDLLAATVSDVVAFFDTYYVPNNATLVVAGDFDAKQVKPLIQGFYGSIPRGKEPPRRSAPPVGFSHVRRVRLTDKVQYPRTTMAWHSPAFYQPGDAAMDLIAFALGSGKNGRLYRRLVREEGLAIDVSVGQTSLRLGSIFRIDVDTKPDADLDRVEAIIDEELVRFLKDGPSERELARGRIDVETSAYTDLESLREVADRLNHYDAFLGRPDGLAWDLARYRRATTTSVRDVARSVLRLDRRLILRVVPKPAADPSLPSLDKRPADLPQPTFTPPLPERFTLPNGLRVWHVKRSGVPLLAARLIMPGGSVAAGRVKAGLAPLAAQMLLEGAGDDDALAFAEALDLLGASLDASAGRESTQVDLRVLARNVDPAFALMARALRTPRFDGASFDRQRGLALDTLNQVVERAPARAGRVATEAWCGKGARYGVPATGYPATVAALTVADVKAYHDHWHGPAGATLITAGDLSLAQVRTIVEKHFAAWKPQRRPALDLPAPRAATGLRVVVVDRPGSAQTAVRFVYPGIGFEHPERIPLRVLNTLFGGSFTSRLNANLREKHGYTYGAGSGFSTMRGRGLFLASANVQTDKTGAAIHEFLEEFKRVRTGDIAAAEAVKARQTVAAEITEAFGTLSGTVGAYTPYARDRVVPDALPGTLGAALACDAKRLGSLARSWIARDGGVLVLVGDRGAIEGQIRELGLAAPLVLSVQEALAGVAAR